MKRDEKIFDYETGAEFVELEDELFDDEMTPEEYEEFVGKFCRGTLKPRLLTEEINQLKKEGRI